MKKTLRIIKTSLLQNRLQFMATTEILADYVGAEGNAIEATVPLIPPEVTETAENIIAAKGNYKLIRVDDEDYHCMEKKTDARWESHRNFENLKQAMFHFYNDHE